jgi:hypothetical protein
MKSHRVGFCWLLVSLLLTGLATGQALTNADFEAGSMAGWETFGIGWRTSSFSNEVSVDAHSGVFGLVNDVKKDDKEEWRGVSQAIPVRKGDVCSATAWIRAFNARHAEGMLEFHFLDEDRKVIDFMQSEIVSGEEPYRQVDIQDATAPKNAEWLLVRGVVHMKAPPPGEEEFIMFDDFQVTVLSKAEQKKASGSTSIQDRIAKRAAERAGSP